MFNIKHIIFLFALVAVACTKNDVQHLSDELPVVELEGEFLYQSDIDKFIPNNITSEDSALYAENFIKKWAISILTYEKANNNISDIEEIEKLVLNYRKSLVIHRYHQKLLEQKVKEPSESEMQKYYDENSEKFKLKENLIKGIYIKVPEKAPKTNDLKKWLSNQKTENLQKIEKYCYQNAVSYEYFGDHWISYDELAKQLPIASEEKQSALSQKLIELEDNAGFKYFLFINESKKIGSVEPFEFAKNKIKAILMNISKTNFINKFEDELYDKALKKEKIKYYRNN